MPLQNEDGRNTVAFTSVSPIHNTYIFLSTFDKRCNDLEGWLMERGYNGKMIRKQILRAQQHSRKDLLEREKAKTS